jgi:hypothetical protein
MIEKGIENKSTGNEVQTGKKREKKNRAKKQAERYLSNEDQAGRREGTTIQQVQREREREKENENQKNLYKLCKVVQICTHGTVNWCARGSLNIKVHKSAGKCGFLKVQRRTAKVNVHFYKFLI